MNCAAAEILLGEVSSSPRQQLEPEGPRLVAIQHHRVSLGPVDLNRPILPRSNVLDAILLEELLDSLGDVHRLIIAHLLNAYTLLICCAAYFSRQVCQLPPTRSDAAPSSVLHNQRPRSGKDLSSIWTSLIKIPYMAGPEGIEPSSSVLETDILAVELRPSADRGTRTLTPVRAPPPQDGAAANYAISASFEDLRALTRV